MQRFSIIIIINNTKADIYWILNPGRAHTDLSAYIVPLNIYKNPDFGTYSLQLKKMRSQVKSFDEHHDTAPKRKLLTIHGDI